MVRGLRRGQERSTAPIRGSSHGSCGVSVLRWNFDRHRAVLAAGPASSAWRIAWAKGQSAAGIHHDGICRVVHGRGDFFSVTTQIAGIDQTALRTAAAVLLATFGALMLWPRTFEWFWVRIGARLMPGDRMVMRFAQGNLGAFALGTALGLVWTPCAGPVLASILTLIATRDSLVSGAVLLLVYAVGAAVPLLAIGWGGQAVTTRVKVFARHSRRLQQGFGAVMIAFAVATYFDYDALIAAWVSRFYPGGQIGL